MARKSLGFVFGVVLCDGVLLAITTWAASPKPQSDSAGPATERLPAGSLEGVLRFGERLRLSRHGTGRPLT